MNNIPTGLAGKYKKEPDPVKIAAGKYYVEGGNDADWNLPTFIKRLDEWKAKLEHHAPGTLEYGHIRTMIGEYERSIGIMLSEQMQTADITAYLKG